MWAGRHNCLANLSSFKWAEETVSYREDLPPPPIWEFTFVFFFFHSILKYDKALMESFQNYWKCN